MSGELAGEKERPSGLSAEELFPAGEELVYDDITILDTRKSTILKKDVSLKTNLGKGVIVHYPIIGSPMDSLVRPEMNIALAQMGCLGSVHYNHKDAEGNPDIGKQSAEIGKVKRSQNGFIRDPVTVAPDMTIAQVIERGSEYAFNGKPISTFPVTHDGTSNGKLVGLLRSDDYFRGSRTDVRVGARMLGLDKLVTGSHGITLPEAREMLWDRKIKSLPIVDDDGRLTYLVTRGDIEKMEQFPNATLDEEGRLRVLFAVSTWPESYERLEKGFAAGADGVIVDTSQGFTHLAIEMLQYVATKYPTKLLIGGNISTQEAARALAKLETVDAFRCGQGSGSICTTAETIGIGRAACSGIYECATSLDEINSPMVTIADGGVRSAGDIVKALSLGAGAVMIGGMLAGSEECPGELITDSRGRLVKEYWGMGSDRARVGGARRARDYGGHEEGVVKLVPYKGSVRVHFPKVIDAILHSFEVLNYQTIPQLQEGMRRGDVRYGRRTNAAVIESKPHD